MRKRAGRMRWLVALGGLLLLLVGAACWSLRPRGASIAIGPLAAINSAGDRVAFVACDPPSPAQLKAGEQVKIRFRYDLRSAGQGLVYVQPWAGGQHIRQGSNSGSLFWPAGAGDGDFHIRFDVPMKVDALRLFLENGDVLPMVVGRRFGIDSELVELRVPVDLTWR